MTNEELKPKAVDLKGYPGTWDGTKFDGGDTAAVVGNLMALKSPDQFKLSLGYMRSMLITVDGPRRHWDASQWWGQTDRFSRDQLIPILCSFVGEEFAADARQLYRLHAKHFFVYAWNKKKNGVMETPDKMPDITGPEVWALWIRVHGGSFLTRLLLPILDLETLVGSITWRWFQPKTNRVCRNHMLVCMTGLKRFPSITMRLANWLNDWDDLLARHDAHCLAVGEYPTSPDFYRVRGAAK